MNNLLLNLYVRFQSMMEREDGQDLVEYALVVALLSFAVVAGMKTLASGVSVVFSNVSTVLASNIT